MYLIWFLSFEYEPRSCSIFYREKCFVCFLDFRNIRNWINISKISLYAQRCMRKIHLQFNRKLLIVRTYSISSTKWRSIGLYPFYKLRKRKKELWVGGKEESHAERHPIMYWVSTHPKSLVFFSKFYLPIKKISRYTKKQIREM